MNAPFPIVVVKTKTNKHATIYYVTRAKNKTPLELDLTDCILLERAIGPEEVQEIYVKQPYLSKKFTVSYEDDNEFFDYGKDIYRYADHSLGQITTTLYEKEKLILTYASNGGPLFHKEHGCERKRLHIPTGQGYDLCMGCNPVNHSEISAIKRAKLYGKYEELRGATAYLYGHWWSCKDCSDGMEEAGIKHLNLSRSWTKEFLEL